MIVYQIFIIFFLEKFGVWAVFIIFRIIGHLTHKRKNIDACYGNSHPEALNSFVLYAQVGLC